MIIIIFIILPGVFLYQTSLRTPIIIYNNILYDDMLISIITSRGTPCPGEREDYHIDHIWPKLFEIIN